MSMGTNSKRMPELISSTNIEKPSKKKLSTSKTMNLQKKRSAKKVTINPLKNLSTQNKRKGQGNLKKFLQNNQIMNNMSRVGRNKNVRFGPEGIFRITQARIAEHKNKQQEKIENERNQARKNLFMKNRDFTSSQYSHSNSLERKGSRNEHSVVENEDILSPLQCLVLLDIEIASSMF